MLLAGREEFAQAGRVQVGTQEAVQRNHAEVRIGLSSTIIGPIRALHRERASEARPRFRPRRGSAPLPQARPPARRLAPRIRVTTFRDRDGRPQIHRPGFTPHRSLHPAWWPLPAPVAALAAHTTGDGASADAAGEAAGVGLGGCSAPRSWMICLAWMPGSTDG